MRIGLIDSANLNMRIWYGIGRGKAPDYRLAATSVLKSVAKFTKYGMFDGIIWVKEGVPVRRIEESLGEYKANREEARDRKREREIAETGSSNEPTTDFFDLVNDLIGAHSVFAVRHESHEADDSIASLAKFFIEQDCKVGILSGDTDFLQLEKDIDIWKRATKITDSDRLLNPPSGISRGEMYLNYKSLIGDPSDNIPGVSGIGKKTAYKAVAEMDFNDFLSSLSDEKRTQFLNAKSMIKFEEVNTPYQILKADLPDWQQTRTAFGEINSNIHKVSEWGHWKNSWSKTIKGHDQMVDLLSKVAEFTKGEK
jgi:5'-3' exonuclease